MKKLSTILSGLIMFGAIVSCKDKHEIIPPPLKTADLECSCKAKIDNVDYTYSDTCTYNNSKNIITSSNSTAQYRTNIQNGAMNQGITMEMRSLTWVDDGSNNPNIESWKSYFTSNMSPNYSMDNNANGVVVKWTDPFGVIWTSDTMSVCPVNFLYTEMEHDSDATGNYMKFRAVFNCTLKNPDGDSKCLENGVVSSSFKRE